MEEGEHFLFVLWSGEGSTWPTTKSDEVCWWQNLIRRFVAVELVYTFHCVCWERPDFFGQVSLLDSRISYFLTELLYCSPPRGSTTMTRYPNHGFRIPREDYLLTRCPSTLSPFVVLGVGVTDKKSPYPTRESVCMWAATTTMERCTTRTTDDTAQRQHSTTTLNNDNAQRLQPSSPSPPTVPTKKTTTRFNGRTDTYSSCSPPSLHFLTIYTNEDDH